MEKKKRHPLARLFFGVFFLLLSAVVLLVNLFRMPGGYDWALGLLDLLTFLGGLPVSYTHLTLPTTPYV